MAALEGIGIALLPDWLVGSALQTRKLVRVLPDWQGKDEGGVYAISPPGRLVPTKTRVFIDAVAESIKAGWGR
jgi:DNA-binding transcriptional LysR family regulator